MRLFLYHTAGAGPAAMLFVKGTRVHALPVLFRVLPLLSHGVCGSEL
jgi:hypothetical protein